MSRATTTPLTTTSGAGGEPENAANPATQAIAARSA
jgi:hypothetical protein